MRSVLRAAGAFCAYLVAVAWLTWPLAARIASDLPDAHGACRFDLPAIAWILASESRNLVARPTHLFAGTAFHPEPSPIAYGPLALGALPLFAPPFLATGNPALAANALFLVGVALTAASFHLVARAWTGSHLAGLTAAWAFLTDRWVLWEFVPTAPFYGVLVWLPWIVYLAAAPRPRARWIVGLAVLVALQGLSDQVYVAPAVLAPLAVLAAVRLARAPTRQSGAALAAALAIAIALLAPFYAPYLRLRTENPELAQQTVWRGGEAAVPLARALWGYQSPASLAPIALVVAAVGGFLRLARGRAAATPASAWAACCAFALVGAVAALPRAVAIAGLTLEPPWYAWLPTLRHLRGTERLAIAALGGLALAAGLGFAEIARAVARLADTAKAAPARPGASRGPARGAIARAVLAAAIALLAHREYQRGFGRPAFERRPLPDAYPTQPALRADDPIVEALRAGSGPLLELPLGPFDVLPPFHARAMYRSIFHGRPLLNGYNSYFPAGFRERMALASRLPDAEALAELRRTTGLSQVLVQTAEIADPERRAAWLELARGPRADLALVARDGDTLLFALRPPAS
ncbi:MAG TPA: hypothetical protein VFD92_15200 [Candidatus Binatia bacterium]|nr:hypothetical protein [Candidatus Binatia bacterium]